jgi:hypothetical protein
VTRSAPLVFGKKGFSEKKQRAKDYGGNRPATYTLVRSMGGTVFLEFDDRTAANMEVALARASAKLSPGQDMHENRKVIASAIIECARAGKTTLGDLTEAGSQAVNLMLRASH